MSSPAPTIPRPLPFWRAVGASYMTVVRNLGQLARISWLWLVILLPVSAAVQWLIWPWTNEVAQREGGTTAELIGYLPDIIELPVLASIAVAWHRLVLHQERMHSAFYLRLDRLVLRYTLIVLAFFVLVLVPEVYAIFLLKDAVDNLLAVAAASINIAIVVLASIFVLPRFSLVLPGIAVGENLSLAGAWRLTRRNTWRLAMATLACSLPLVAPFAFLMWYFPRTTRTSMALTMTLNTLVYVLIVTVGVTLLSLAYRHFVWRQDIGAPPSA